MMNYNDKMWKASTVLCCTGLGIFGMAYRIAVTTKMAREVNKAVKVAVDNVVNTVTGEIIETTGETIEE